MEYLVKVVIRESENCFRFYSMLEVSEFKRRYRKHVKTGYAARPDKILVTCL